jgi:hypothetical protein
MLRSTRSLEGKSVPSKTRNDCQWLDLTGDGGFRGRSSDPLPGAHTPAGAGNLRAVSGGADGLEACFSERKAA